MKDTIHQQRQLRGTRSRPLLCRNNSPPHMLARLMDRQREKSRLEGELAKYAALSEAFPVGAVNETMLDPIGELKDQLRKLAREE